MSSELLDRAIEQIKSGEKQRGQQLLALALVEDPQSVRGWLWLSACVAEAEKKRYCLQKALEVAPNLETVQRALAELPATVASEILTEPVAPLPETAPPPATPTAAPVLEQPPATTPEPTEPAEAEPFRLIPPDYKEEPSTRQKIVTPFLQETAVSDRKTVPVRPPYEMPSFEASPTRPVVRLSQEKTKPTKRRIAGVEEGGWVVQDSPQMERRITLIVFLLVILIGVLLATVLTYFYLL